MTLTYEALKRRKHDILQIWEREVRQHLLGTRKESSPVLINNIPTFLDTLVEKLKMNLSESNYFREKKS